MNKLEAFRAQVRRVQRDLSLSDEVLLQDLVDGKWRDVGYITATIEENEQMGNWTDILLSMGCEDGDREEECLAKVNTFFQDPASAISPEPLVREERTSICVGSYKSLDLDAFLKHINTIEWSDPKNVQVFIKVEGDYQFKIIKGVQAYDSRFEDRDRLLSDVEYLIKVLHHDTLSELIKQVTSDWLADYKTFKEENV